MLVIKIKYVRDLPFDIEVYENNTHRTSYLTIHDIPAISDIIRREVKRYEESFRNQSEEANKD